jgi:hypothetical protein
MGHPSFVAGKEFRERRLLVQDLAGDDQALDLAGAFADGA